MLKKSIFICIIAALSLSLAGCSGKKSGDIKPTEPPAVSYSPTTGAINVDDVRNLIITFGYEGEPFNAVMEDNETAKELIRDIGISGEINLPVYHFDDFEGCEYMQYYDIPSRYTIPSSVETITSEKAGEIYYSDDNRLTLFYRDAEIEGNYVKVGQIENTENLQSAVENNPVLEGWGNKIVSIRYAD